MDTVTLTITLPISGTKRDYEETIVLALVKQTSPEGKIALANLLEHVSGRFGSITALTQPIRKPQPFLVVTP